jgi:hypothetical protein
MDDCVRILREEKETKLDLLLAFQAKCHVVVEQITHSPFEWGVGDEMTRSTAAYFVKALQRQLQDIRQSVPAEMQSERQSQALPEKVVESKLSPNRNRTVVSLRHGNPWKRTAALQTTSQGPDRSTETGWTRLSPDRHRAMV